MLWWSLYLFSSVIYCYFREINSKSISFNTLKAWVTPIKTAPTTWTKEKGPLFLKLETNKSEITLKLSKSSETYESFDMYVFDFNSFKKYDDVSESHCSQLTGKYFTENGYFIVQCNQEQIGAEILYQYLLTGVFCYHGVHCVLYPNISQNLSLTNSFQHTIFSLHTLPKHDMCNPTIMKSRRNITALDKSRHRRKTDKEVIQIEVSLFIDKTIYDHFKHLIPDYVHGKIKKIRRIIFAYYSSLLNMVDNIFNTLSTLKYSIRLKIDALIILDVDIVPFVYNLPYYPREIRSSFKKWMDRKNYHIASDFVLYISLHNTFDFKHPGFTQSNSSCSNDTLVFVSERLNLRTSFVVTRLIAKSLGIPFDTVNSECDPDQRFIMSDRFYQIIDTELNWNLFSFSPCSKEFFATVIQNGRHNQRYSCLWQQNNKKSVPFNLLLKPGQWISASQQCYHAFRQHSDIYRCEEKNFSKKGFCMNMLCYFKGICIGIIPLEGTTCGKNKWCINGHCTHEGNPPSIPMNCWLGNRDSRIAVDDANSCRDAGFGRENLCYQDHFRNRCCYTCALLRRKWTNCLFGDYIRGCRRKLCVHYTPQMKQNCCLTCGYHTSSSQRLNLTVSVDILFYLILLVLF